MLSRMRHSRASLGLMADAEREVNDLKGMTE
jgi:hypothetical protein